MKSVLRLLIIVLLCLLLVLPISASDVTDEFMQETIDDWNEQLDDMIPEEAKDLLSNFDLEALNLHAILSLQPQQFIQLLNQLWERSWREPLSTLGTVSAFLLLTAVFSTLQDTAFLKNNDNLFDFLAVVCLCSCLGPPVLQCMERGMEHLERCADFLIALVPLLITMLLMGGQTMAAGTYQLVLFAVCQFVSHCAVRVFLPLIRFYFVLSVVSAAFPTLNLSGLLEGIRRFVFWTLGTLTTVFVSFLTLQSFVGSSVDSVAKKAGRLLTGSFVPIVGSILSDAYGTAQACLSILRGSLGTFAVLVSACIVLPILLQTVLWYLVSGFTYQLSGMLQVSRAAALLKAANNTFAILLALLCCFFLLLLFAVTLLVFIGSGG